MTQPAIPLRVIRDGATACGKRGLSSEAWGVGWLRGIWWKMGGADVI